MITNPTRTILALGQGLAVIDHESAWQRLETINDMLVADNMELKETALALELKALMIKQVHSNHKENVINKSEGLSPKDANEKAICLMLRHNRRLLALREAKTVVDQSNYH